MIRALRGGKRKKKMLYIIIAVGNTDEIETNESMAEKKEIQIAEGERNGTKEF